MEKMRGSANRLFAGAVMTGAALVLAACGGGGGGGTPPTGTVRMSLIDAQCGYENVFVNVKEVRIQKSPTASDSEGGWISIPVPDGPKQIDLLNLTNGTFLDLGGAEVEAGTYEQLRLVLEDTGNYVVMEDGTRHDLKTPSAQQSGLKIKAPYTVAADTTTEYVLDFDACKSIVIAGKSGQWILKPVVRLTTKPTGSIAGYVTTTMVVGTATTTVTAQQAGEVVRTASPDPATGAFKLPYLTPGTYTVVITSTDRATGVISTVPVGTTTTVLNGTSSYIVTPSSPMSTVSGTVTAGSTLVTDAYVTATQAVAAGGPIQVMSVPVDLDLATYTMKLPTADPYRANYSTSGLSFANDTTANGTYTVTSSSPTKGTKSVVFNSRAASSTVLNLNY